jgi:hypothetical protein
MNRRPDWTDIFMRWRWETDRLVFQAMLPGLTPGEIRDIKRQERYAREQRRYAQKKAVEEIRATLARWESPEPKKPTRPVQLELPLPNPPR